MSSCLLWTSNSHWLWLIRNSFDSRLSWIWWFGRVIILLLLSYRSNLFFSLLRLTCFLYIFRYPSENGTALDARAVINYIDRILKRLRPDLPPFWNDGSRKQYCQLDQLSRRARVSSGRRPHLFLYGKWMSGWALFLLTLCAPLPRPKYHPAQDTA